MNGFSYMRDNVKVSLRWPIASQLIKQGTPNKCN